MNRNHKGKIRSIIFAAGLLLALSASGLPIPTVEKPIAPIETTGGLVAGKVLPSGVKAWFGVPYAAPPLRELRWKPPQPVEWSGVYNADRFAPECIQELRGSRINHYFGNEATSEDCLYLNIWAPADADEGDRPVIVWIYGGGLRIGSAAMRNYSGEGLAKKGAVYVSMGYRVGVLGFLAHPELTAESPHGASGNYGMLDQVAALQWVHDNIARFGGDPGNVTVMGQSGGGRSVTALQVSPLAKGLLHRAVSMSGVVAAYPDSREQAEQQGLALQAALGAESVDDMRHIAADRIHAIQREYFSGLIVDGYYFPEPPGDILAKGAFSDVPLIVGHTADDGTGPLQNAITLESYRKTVTEMYGDKADEFLQLFPADNDAEARRMARAAALLSGREGGAIAWSNALSEFGSAAVYGYQFSRVQPYTPGITFADHDPATVGAYHTADVPYWLETLDALNLFRETRTWTRFDRELADLMSDAILQFAKTGSPDHGSFRWPVYTPEEKRIVDFGSGEDLWKVVPWYHSDKLPFFLENDARTAQPIRSINDRAMY